MKVAILGSDTSSEVQYLASVLEKAEHQVRIVSVFERTLEVLQSDRPDICCIASDTSENDGALQGMLDLARVPYVGSSSEVCHLAKNDRLIAYVLGRYAEAAEENYSVEPLASFALSHDLLRVNKEAFILLCEERIPGSYPFEVLQDGIATKVDDRGAFEQCVDAFLENDSASDKGSTSATLEVRQWVEGIALSVAVLGTGWDAHVLPPVEQTAEATYVAPVRMDHLSVNEEMAQAIRSEIERCAFEICLALGVQDFAVVRLIWDGAQVRLAGVDVAPSMAEGGVFATACVAAGLSIEGVLDHLVSL